jgi:hypothetical protein
LLVTFIAGCGSSALTDDRRRDGSPPDKWSVASPDEATTIPDLPVIEVKASAVDAAEDRPIAPPKDASAAPDAPEEVAASPDVPLLPPDAPVVRDAPIADEQSGQDVLDPGRDADLDGARHTLDVPPDGYWPPQITYLGQTLTLAWCGDERMDWNQTIRDLDVRGTGACANTTLEQLLAQVPASFRLDAGYQPGGCYPRACYTDKDIRVLRHGEGFRLVFVYKDNGPGMHSVIRCNYFETDGDCHPVQVGYFADRDMMFDCVGAPLWGYPVGRYCEAAWSGCTVDAGVGWDNGM